jgi:hypothetical protein
LGAWNQERKNGHQGCRRSEHASIICWGVDDVRASGM